MGHPASLAVVCGARAMSRAFSALGSIGFRTWGFTPRWYESGLWPSRFVARRCRRRCLWRHGPTHDDKAVMGGAPSIARFLVYESKLRKLDDMTARIFSITA